MANCDICGTTYTPTAESPDCPACARRRAATRRPSASAGARARPASGTRPAARRVVARQPEEEEEDAEPSWREDQRGMLDSAAKMGLIIAGGLSIIVAMVVFFTMRTRAEKERAEQAYDQEIQALHDELAKLNLTSETDAKRVIDLAAQKEERWKEHRLGHEIQTLVARAKTSMESGKERRESVARFEEIEKQLANPQSLAPENLEEMRRRLEALEMKVTVEGGDALARFTATRTAIDKAYGEALLRAVQATSETSSNARTALVTSQKAEDEIRKLIDKAYQAKNQELQDTYIEMFQRAIRESDRLAAALFATEPSDLPWTDCLSGEQVSRWNASSVPGFSHRVENGVLQIVGPDAESGRQAVISIGDREQWRNFVLDFEFTVERGGVELIFRLGRSPNPSATVSCLLASEGPEKNLLPGRSYHAVAKLVGSAYTLRFATEDLDTPSPREETLTWAKNRKGAIGFVVPPGARLRVTTFKVRELR